VATAVSTPLPRRFPGDPCSALPAHQRLGTPLFMPLLGLLSALVGDALYDLAVSNGRESSKRIKFPDFLKAGLGASYRRDRSFSFRISRFGLSSHCSAPCGPTLVGHHLLLIGVKVLATSITLGSGGSGGTFAPALLLVSMAGGAFGSAVHWLLPGVTALPGGVQHRRHGRSSEWNPPWSSECHPDPL